MNDAHLNDAGSRERSYGGHYPLPRRIVSREEYILAHCAGKRVLHLGCVDQVGGVRLPEEVHKDRWLHGKIVSVAKDVVGLDNCAEGVHLLTTVLKYQNVYETDVQHLGPPVYGRFQTVIAGEILEHLPNPGSLFSGLGEWLTPGGEIVLTTANAYCLRRLLRVAFGTESVHPDHVAYYSHRTVSRLAQEFGFQAIEQCSYRLTNRHPMGPYVFERLTSMLSPNICEGLIVRLVATSERASTPHTHAAKAE